MTYKLAFLPTAKKEWDKLDGSVRTVFKKKVLERLETPRVESAKLRGYDDFYKIKLRDLGYRLVYEVVDDEVVIYVIAVGRRDKIYGKLAGRKAATDK